MRSAALKLLFASMLVVTLGTAHLISNYQSQRTDERLYDQRTEFQERLDTIESRLREDITRLEQKSQIDTETTQEVIQAVETMFDDARAEPCAAEKK